MDHSVLDTLPKRDIQEATFLPPFLVHPLLPLLSDCPRTQIWPPLFLYLLSLHVLPSNLVTSDAISTQTPPRLRS